MKRILSTLTVMVILLSCSQNAPAPNQKDDQKDANNEQQDPIKNNEGDPSVTPQGEYICSGHQINRYYKISDLSIKEDALKKGQNGGYTMTVEFVTKNFYGYRKPVAEVSKFAQCAKKFGDTASRMRCV